MKVIVPTFITEAMLLSSSVAEPDTVNNETAWSATEINVDGDRRYIGAPNATVGITNANPAVVSWTANGLAEDTAIVFSTSGTLPAGITAGDVYYLHTRLTADTFTIAASIGGRQIKTTSAGSGTHTATAKVHKIYEASLGTKATISVTIASPGVVAWTAHNLAANTPVVFTTTGALPTGLVAGTTYYVKTVSDADHFTVSATVGGSAINTSGSQSGVHTGGSGTSELGVNYNKAPLLYPDIWTEVSATNKWAFADGVLGSPTSNADQLLQKLQPGRFDGLGLLQADAGTAEAWLEINRGTVTFDTGTDKVNHTAHGYAADTEIRFETTGTLPGGITEHTSVYVKAPTTNDYQVAATAGGAAINLTGVPAGTHTAGQVAWDYSKNLVDRSNVGNWYDYWYQPPLIQDTVAQTEIVDSALIDLPPYSSGVLFVKLDRAGGSVGLGELVVGMTFDLGDTNYGATAGIKNYSTIDRNEFGNVSITRRDYTSTMRATTRVAKADVDGVTALLKTYKDTPLLFIGADDIYGTFIVYGLVTDWELTADEPLWAKLRLEVEGLV